MVLSGQQWVQLLLFASTLLFLAGLTFCLISLHHYAFGIYFILISIMGYIIGFSFCVAEPGAQTEQTIAKQMWSRAQKSFKRPSCKKLQAQKRVRHRIVMANVQDLMSAPLAAINHSSPPTAPISDSGEKKFEVSAEISTQIDKSESKGSSKEKKEFLRNDQYQDSSTTASVIIPMSSDNSLGTNSRRYSKKLLEKSLNFAADSSKFSQCSDIKVLKTTSESGITKSVRQSKLKYSTMSDHNSGEATTGAQELLIKHSKTVDFTPFALPCNNNRIDCVKFSRTDTNLSSHYCSADSLMLALDNDSGSEEFITDSNTSMARHNRCQSNPLEFEEDDHVMVFQSTV